MSISLRLALRDLRGGLAGFRVFLVCLALGVAGVAAVGSVESAIRAGLAAEGRAILGGDLAAKFTYRRATDDERAWLSAQGSLSEIADLRSMVTLDADRDERALAQVKAVDAAWPLVGEARIAGAGPEMLAPGPDGLPGIAFEPVLAERLAVSPGDRIRLGTGTFRYVGPVEQEPDRAAAGFGLGPRALVRLEALEAAGLMQTGTIFETELRLAAPGSDPARLAEDFAETFPDSGARLRDRNDAAPGIRRFVERLGAFLTLVGLAALAIGGVGVGAAVRGHLTRKVPVIAALRTLGASGGEVMRIYLLQVGLMAALGVAIGLMLGGGLVAGLGPWLASGLPVPARFGLYPVPLAVAGLFGMLTAAVFTLWPLAWIRELRPAQLFRGLGEGRPAGWRVWGLLALLVAGSGAAVVALSGAPMLALRVLGALGAAFVLLRCLGWGLARAARGLSHTVLVRRRPGLWLALGAIGAPGGQTPGVVVALGLALGVLAAIGQIDWNMQRLIRDQLPAGAPAFFLVDIQTHQLDAVRGLLEGVEGVTGIETAPMLRGVVTRLNDVPAAEAKIDPAGSWVLRGDRGVTYSATPPPGTRVTAGAWWPEDYSGPPLVSFAAEEGAELGLSVGSTVTVSILGRPITATVANLREVEWRGMGINFLMVMSPSALSGAPHTHIATVEAAPRAEAPVMRALGREAANVTIVRVRDQVERVSGALSDLGAATRWAALAVLVTGLAVLMGAAAAGVARQRAEAAILRSLGATRAMVLGSFALRSALLGAGAGLVALGWGTIAAWAVTVHVLEADFSIALLPAVAVVTGGALLNLLAGIGFSLRPVSLRPARVLREAAG